MARMFKKILIANRGEIAVRIIRACRELGITSVAVYSDADRKALHVRLAEEAYYIGESVPSQSYLNIEKIIETAKKCKAEAIHPGYGFLSENATFSQKCRDHNIIFIGPGPDAIRSMGDKITARKTMIAAGVPVVPGTTEPIREDVKAIEVIREIGLPVMIKASSGGGGKGMRLVKKEEEVESAIRMARSIAIGNT